MGGVSLQVVLILVALALTLTRHATQGLVFELPDKQEACFYQDFDGSERYYMEYKVIRGGKHDVDLAVSSPTGLSIYKKNKRKQDAFTFETSYGKYSFCFNNRFSTISHKLIYFNVRPETPKTQRDQIGDKSYSVNTKAEAYMENIYLNMGKVVEFQTNYRTNEARGRFAAEELNLRVQWWSLFESVIILCSGLGQVLVLRAFFTDRERKKQPQDTIGSMTPPMSMPVNKL